MFLSPYQTTTCKNYNIPNIVDNVRKDLMAGGSIMPLYGPNLFTTTANVRILSPKAASRQFTQILTPLELTRPEDPDYVVDGRTTLTVNRQTRETTAKVELDYNRSIMLVSLISHWQQDHQSRMDLLNISPLCGRVYASYMGNRVSRMLNLDLEYEFMIGVVAAWYYYCSFYTKEEFTSNRRDLAARYINQWTRLPPQRALPIIEKLDHLEDLAEFVEALKVIIGGPGVQQLTVGLLLSKISNGWFDNSGKENLVVAFEYPPMWVYICVAALDTRSFSRSEVGKLIQQLSTGGLGDQLLKNFKIITGNVK